MPYFIYSITQNEQQTSRKVAYLKDFENFRDAKKDVKELRANQAADDSKTFRVIFAAEQAEAEKLLLEHREQPIAKEWEK